MDIEYERTDLVIVFRKKNTRCFRIFRNLLLGARDISIILGLYDVYFGPLHCLSVILVSIRCKTLAHAHPRQTSSCFIYSFVLLPVHYYSENLRLE